MIILTHLQTDGLGKASAHLSILHVAVSGHASQEQWTDALLTNLTLLFAIYSNMKLLVAEGLVAKQ